MSYLHKVTKVGRALGICLPKAYTDHYKIERGHFCIAKISAEGNLVLWFFDPDKRPDLLEEEEKIIEAND